MVTSRSEIVKLTAEYVGVLNRQAISVDRVYLFGSYARGTADQHSDIDLVVISPDFRGKDGWDRAAILARAGHPMFAATGECIEAIARTPEEVAGLHPASFLADVLRNAEPVYQRSPAAA